MRHSYYGAPYHVEGLTKFAFELWSAIAEAVNVQLFYFWSETSLARTLHMYLQNFNELTWNRSGVSRFFFSFGVTHLICSSVILDEAVHIATLSELYIGLHNPSNGAWMVLVSTSLMRRARIYHGGEGEGSWVCMCDTSWSYVQAVKEKNRQQDSGEL